MGAYGTLLEGRVFNNTPPATYIAVSMQSRLACIISVDAFTIGPVMQSLMTRVQKRDASAAHRGRGVSASDFAVSAFGALRRATSPAT